MFGISFFMYVLCYFLTKDLLSEDLLPFDDKLEFLEKLVAFLLYPLAMLDLFE